ncbi:hypothetical protein IGJ68_000071 [Enterococcus sp. DIV0564]
MKYQVSWENKLTNDFEELESVFFDSGDWELKIIKN